MQLLYFIINSLPSIHRPFFVSLKQADMNWIFMQAWLGWFGRNYHHLHQKGFQGDVAQQGNQQYLPCN